jgi:hypothetical protein
MEGTRRPAPPPDIMALGRARAIARRARDWTEADRLRAQIEAAGWRVVDRGTEFTLRPAHPPDAVEGGRMRYGSSASVPSRLDEPPATDLTVLVLHPGSAPGPADLGVALAAAASAAPREAQLVVVLDDPDDASVAVADRWSVAARDPGRDAELLLTSAPSGPATCLAAGLRRSVGRVVLVVDSASASGLHAGAVAGAVAELRAPEVAVVGAVGSVSARLPSFQRAPAGPVDVIDGGWLAFRRDDARRTGPIDERYRSFTGIARWLSLVLRDEGPGAAPRRAVACGRAASETGDRDDARVARAATPEERRDAYRLLDAFRDRGDLLSM